MSAVSRQLPQDLRAMLDELVSRSLTIGFSAEAFDRWVAHFECVPKARRDSLFEDLVALAFRFRASDQPGALGAFRQLCELAIVALQGPDHRRADVDSFEMSADHRSLLGL